LLIDESFCLQELDVSGGNEQGLGLSVWLCWSVDVEIILPIIKKIIKQFYYIINELKKKKDIITHTKKKTFINWYIKTKNVGRVFISEGEGNASPYRIYFHNFVLNLIEIV
jgi:hypothetical protein